MADKDSNGSRTAEVQVFELTMDNTEDQDELNRRFRKPGEPDRLQTCRPTGPAIKSQGAES